MALSSTELGLALYDVRNAFNNLTIDDINTQYGGIEAARQAQAIAEAEVIINHFKNKAVLTVPGTGMLAGPYSVTGTSSTGKLS